MEVNVTKKQIAFFFAISISLITLSIFFYLTGIFLKPLVLILISIFILSPFAKESPFVKRLLVLILVLFAGWMLSDLGFTVIPFIASFFLAYLIDPFVSKLQEKGIPRGLIAFLFVACLIGVIVFIAVVIFPIVFDQLDEAINKISQFVEDVKNYLDSRKFYAVLREYGISKANSKYIVQAEILPKIEVFMSKVLESLRSLLTNISALANQLFNIVLFPILLFYFIKDFRKVIYRISEILEIKNQKFLYDLRRIGGILRKYAGWQIIAAIMVATVCSFFFYLFDLPYPIILGIFCGIFNPIPYLGIFASMIISSLTVMIVGSPFVVNQILVIVVVISAMHFINAYLIEPNIAGKMIGLHPVLLIASLFVFGGMWGFFGLIIAVPTTATLMMYFEDWVKKIKMTKI